MEAGASGTARVHRQGYIELVEDTYFGGMTRGDIEPILDLFLPGATITVFYGASPVRVMRAEPRDGEEPLRDFFARAVDTFDVRYSDFQHVVDTEAERIWSMYTLQISPKPGVEAPTLPTQRLRNCNYFELNGGRLKAVTAYFANPPAIPVKV